MPLFLDAFTEAVPKQLKEDSETCKYLMKKLVFPVVRFVINRLVTTYISTKNVDSFYSYNCP